MRIKRRRIKRGRIEIIPMIDTIVILLIFYMAFSRFAEASMESNLKLPASKAGDEADVGGRVIINMFSADEVRIDKQPFKITQVTDYLIALRNKARERDPNAPPIAVVLRGQKDMKYKDLSDFMKACSKAGVVDVTFATSEAR